jgi:hypothetical protein
MREYSFLQNVTRRAASVAESNSPCRRNPVIVPQPPTKTPKSRQKTEKLAEDLQVQVRFQNNFVLANWLVIRDL